jgi:hypothetical protein
MKSKKTSEQIRLRRSRLLSCLLLEDELFKELGMSVGQRLLVFNSNVKMLRRLVVNGKNKNKLGDPEEWPEDLRVQLLPAGEENVGI